MIGITGNRPDNFLGEYLTGRPHRKFLEASILFYAWIYALLSTSNAGIVFYASILFEAGVLFC